MTRSEPNEDLLAKALQRGLEVDATGYLARSGQRVGCMVCSDPIASDQIGGIYDVQGDELRFFCWKVNCAKVVIQGGHR